MILVRNLRLPLGGDEADAARLALKRLRLGEKDVAQTQVHKVSVDARRRPPTLVYTVAVQLQDPAGEASVGRAGADIAIVAPRPLQPRPGTQPLPGPVVVCGLGPAGIFCALELAEAGFAPRVLERGPNMQKRRAAVKAFEAGGALQPEANIQFGEGGAGTFSDGKLTSRIGDALCAKVTQRLLEAGAPPDIAWRSRPHIGTDLLQDVFVGLRQRLLALGGQVHFDTRLDGLQLQAGRLQGVETSQGAVNCGVLVLACGHSARDTFTALAKAGIEPQSKAFSVGVRAEHLQQGIDEGLYHEAAGHPALPVGEFQLAGRFAGRGVYTFCMCPGGSVVAAASEAGGVVTNGMSLHARGGPNANAAVVAAVDAADFGQDPFAGVDFQRRLEAAAYAAGGGGYAAPAETLGSFFSGSGLLQPGRVRPSYPLGVRAANLGALLPDKVTAALRQAFAGFGRKLPGYDAPDTVLTGLETRTSSPLRFVRNDELESVALPGLYPCGEGPGYAGGIMSAAVDGIRVAHAIIEKYRPALSG